MQKLQFIKISKKNRAWTMVLVLIGMIVLSAIISPNFRTPRNLLNILNQNSIYGIMALGMGCIMLTGSIDLSAGSIACLAGVLAAPIFGKYGMAAGFAVGISLGFVLGLINGLLITKGRIAYFVVTLGMMQVARGIVYVITNGVPVQGIPTEFKIVGMGKIAGFFPVSALIWLVLAVVMALLLKYTRFGQYVYALGGNERAAWLSGVDKDLIKIMVYAIGGAFFALGGLVLTLRVLMATADACQSYEMTAIASCVIGGIAMDGGQGNILSSIIGALIMGLVMNMLQLMGISSYWQQIFTGAIIIAAVAVDSISSKK